MPRATNSPLSSRLAKIALPAIAGLVGGMFTGVPAWWVAYTNYDSATSAKPYSERQGIVESFNGQIASAERRGDKKTVAKLRQEYEQYEATWRNSIALAQLVRPIENLATPRLSAAQTQEVGRLLGEVRASPNGSPAERKTLGMAYFAVGDFDQATRYLSSPPIGARVDPETYAVRAASFSALAASEKDLQRRTYYKAAATQNVDLAKRSGILGEQQIDSFVEQSAKLQAASE